MSSSSQPHGLPYAMPEDPPEYGEDGLHYLNASTTEPMEDGIITDSITPDGGKQLDKLSDEVVLTPTDIARTQIEEQNAARREMVWKRRNPSNPILRAFQTIVPYGGIVSSAFNLASSTIGAGIIALPAAFQVSGVAMSIVYLIIVALTSVYSFVLLAIVAEKTGLRNWEKITRTLLGRGADYFLAFVMWFLCFGGDVSYIISLQGVLRGFIINSDTNEYIRSNSGIRLITSMVWLIVILPMCLPKEINSLRYLSTIAICLIVFFVISMLVHSGQTLNKTGIRDDIVYFRSGNMAVQGLSIYLFAYISQVNACEVYGEMYKPSVSRMFLAASLGVGLCFTLYFLAGFFGYMDFGSTVTDSVLDLYNPIEDKLMAVSYAGIMLKLCVGFALHLIPCRDAIYYCLGVDVSEVTWWKNCILCIIQATCALVAGLFIPRITTVFGLLGGFCGGFIGFIFPALFMMYSGGFSISTVGWKHYLATYFLLLVGVVAVVFGTSAAIYGEVMAEISK